MNIYSERMSKNELGLSNIHSNEFVSSSKYLSDISSVFLRHIVKYKRIKCELLLHCGCFAGALGRYAIRVSVSLLGCPS